MDVRIFFSFLEFWPDSEIGTIKKQSSFALLYRLYNPCWNTMKDIYQLHIQEGKNEKAFKVFLGFIPRFFVRHFLFRSLPL